MSTLSLRKLVVENFRSVQEATTLDFSAVQPGLYFVRGDNQKGQRLGSNGSGKSTFFIDAIYWVLTGKVARSKRPGDSVENWYADGTTRVEIVLSIGNENHIIERTRRPNNLVLDGVKVEQPEIDRLVPIADAALRRSILIDQFGEMFLSLGAEDKSRIFSETLELDRWVAASELAGDVVSGLQKEMIGLESDIKATTVAIEALRIELQESEAAEEAFEAQLKTLIKEAAAKAREAAREADEMRTALDKARAALARYSDKVEAVRALNTAKADRAKVVGSIQSLERLLGGEERNIQSLKRGLSQYDGDDKTCPECGQKVDQSHLKAKRDKAAKDLKEAEIGADEIKKQLASTKLDLEDYDAFIAEAETGLVEWNGKQNEVSIAAERSIAADRVRNHIEDEIKALKERENPHGEKCDRLADRIKSLRKKLKEVQEKADANNKQVEVAKFWQRGFREIRLEQIDTALAELELTTNKHAESLGLDDWEIAFATERENKKGTVSLGFNVSLIPPGQGNPQSWDAYCGGESQRWQLATTFGLAEVLLSRSGVDPDFEVLDEPTIHLSPEGIDDLLSCLHDRAHELKRRIFLIDHHALSQGNFDGVVFIVKNNKGTRLADNSVFPAPKKGRERL